jgi:hypothetical protein
MALACMDRENEPRGTSIRQSGVLTEARIRNKFLPLPISLQLPAFDDYQIKLQGLREVYLDIILNNKDDILQPEQLTQLRQIS